MSRIPCNVNKDLLPLYVDDVCSEESRELVEEHLSECEDCQNYYGAMKEGISKEEFEGDKESLISKEQERKAQVSVIKGVKKQIANRHVRTISIMVVIGLLLVFVLEGLNGAYMWTPLQKFPLFDVRPKLSEMEVTELYELEGGYLYITVEMEEGSYIVVPSNMDPVLDDNGKTGRYEGEIVLTKHLSDPIASARTRRCSFIYPICGMIEDEDGNMIMAEDSAIRLTGKGDESQVIWEEGQSVEGAPSSIESIAKRRMWEDDAAVEEEIGSGEYLGSLNGKPYVIMWDAED